MIYKEVGEDMSYFVGVSSVKQLKIKYRRLAAKCHPDRGGDFRQMQEINAYYEHVLKKLKSHEKSQELQGIVPSKQSDWPRQAMSFYDVKVGDTVYINGTEGEVINVGDESFRVVAKGRARQAILNKADGKGKYNVRLNASYDNRHKKQRFSTAI